MYGISAPRGKARSPDGQSADRTAPFSSPPARFVLPVPPPELLRVAPAFREIHGLSVHIQQTPVQRTALQLTVPRIKLFRILTNKVFHRVATQPLKVLLNVRPHAGYTGQRRSHTGLPFRCCTSCRNSRNHSPHGFVRVPSRGCGR